MQLALNVKLKEDRIIQYMTILDMIELDTEIREMQRVVYEISSKEPINEGALNYAKSDLAYLLTLLSN